MSEYLPTPRGPRPADVAPYQHPRPDRPIGDGFEPAEQAIDIRELLLVIRRQWPIVLLATLLCLGLTTFVVMSAEPRYRASAALRLQDERSMLTGGMETSMLEGMMGRQTDPLLSQMQVLRSRAVMGEVVEQLGLRVVVADGSLPRSHVPFIHVAVDAPADTVALKYSGDEYTLETGSRAVSVPYGDTVSMGGVSLMVTQRPAAESAVLHVAPHDAVVDYLIQEVRATQRDRTNVFDLEFVSRDPILAQAVVNTAALVFNERNIEAAQQQSRRRRDFVEARLVETAQMLEQAQRELSAFQTREQLFSSRERFAAQQVTLHTLDVRREELVAERDMFQSLLRQIAGEQRSEGGALRAVISAPGIAQNPVISQLYMQLVRYEVAQDSMRATGSSATNPDAVRAASLIASTEQNLIDAVQSHISSVTARISALDEMRSRNSAELAAMPQVQAEEAVLLLEVETIQRMADQLREEAQRARIAEAVEAGQVEIVDLSPLPREPVDDRKPLKLALGMLLGLMLGSGAAFMRENLNTAIRSRGDVDIMLHASSLTVVPKLQSANGRGRVAALLPGLHRRRASTAPAETNGHQSRRSSLVALVEPQSAAAEAYRTLRTNLIFAQASHAISNLVITSSVAGEGKTTTAGNLAVSYAQQGISVLLVDADLRRPQQHVAFGVTREPGLTDLVLERVGVDEVIRRTEVPGLSVVTAGIMPPNPAELVGGPRMRTAMAKLAEGFDLVIIDTPPILAASEGAILGARADAVVLVVRAGKTDRDSARQALAQLRTVAANVVGVVLNDADGSISRYGRYDHYYHTYYGADETIPS